MSESLFDPMNFEDLNFTFDELASFTNDFHTENLIGKFQFGRVYRGIYADDDAVKRQVTIKIWEDPKTYFVDHPAENRTRLWEELQFLRKPKIVSHPNLMRVIGHCHKGERLGIAYDFSPLNSVHNLLMEENFTWIKRIKVILQLAQLLEFLGYGYLVRNIDTNHLMLDEAFNVKIFDFSMISGVVFPSKTRFEHFVHGCYGYIDPYTALTGKWSYECDTFALGIVLLELIAKRTFDVEGRDGLSCPVMLNFWAEDEYKNHKSKWRYGKFSLVHESLRADPDFDPRDGPEITSLALACVKKRPKERPTKQEVVQKLLKLHACHSHAEILGIEDIIADLDASEGKTNFLGSVCKSLGKLNCNSQPDVWRPSSP